MPAPEAIPGFHSRYGERVPGILVFIAHTGNPMLKHNSYFNGSVQSIGFERHGLRATVGVIASGEQHHFNTAAAERMTVVSGLLRANLGGAWSSFPAGTYFEVVANSGFDVQAVGGPAAYLCEFLG